jgi:hypothetical protein
VQRVPGFPRLQRADVAGGRVPGPRPPLVPHGPSTAPAKSPPVGCKIIGEFMHAGISIREESFACPPRCCFVSSSQVETVMILKQKNDNHSDDDDDDDDDNKK